MALSTFVLWVGMDGSPELFPHPKPSNTVLNIYFLFIKWEKLSFSSPSVGGSKREADSDFGVL